MLETIGIILAALLGVIAVGAIGTAYVMWRSLRRMEDAAAEDGDQRAQRPIWRPQSQRDDQ